MSSDSETEELDLDRFNKIIDEYSKNFKNPPKSAYQLVQFCKDRSYDYKYGELNPYYSVWSKQQQKNKKKSITKGNISNENTPAPEINWDAFWNEYQTKYKYPPKKAMHLWNFAKEEKFVSVKYKEARHAFDRINRIKQAENNTIEGHTSTKTNTGLTSNDKQNILVLKITKYTSDNDLIFIKEKFLELLNGFRKSIKHDPANPLQLFNFINEDTKYKVRYGDVKKCYNYAVKHKWFKPMKRMKRMKKRRKKKTKKGNTNEGTDENKNNNNNNDNNDNNNDNDNDNNNDNNNDNDNDNNNDNDIEGEPIGQNEFILEIDHETIQKQLQEEEEEEKQEIVVNNIMSDEQFDNILFKYNIKYNNPPRNPSQIMNFAKEINQIFKYKACRIAFNRWDRLRNRKMPKCINEPGQNVEQENQNDEQENQNDEQENQNVEQENQNVEQENQNVEQENQNDEQENQNVEQENQNDQD